MASGTALSSLTVQAAIDATAYTQGADQKSAADTKMVASGDALAGSLTLTQQKLSDTGSGFDRFVRSIDPVAASTAKVETGLARIQGALDAGNISTERAAELITLLNERYAAGATAANENATAVAGAAAVSDAYNASIASIITTQDRLANSLAGVSASVKSAYAASIQPIDQTTAAITRNYQASLAAGQLDRDNLATKLSVANAYTASLDPLSHLTQATEEAGQGALGLAAANERVTISSGELREEARVAHDYFAGDYNRMIGSSIVALNQWGAANELLAEAMKPPVLGALAMVAAFAIVIDHAANLAAQTRDYTVALDAMHTSQLASGAELTKMADDLHGVGVSATDAQAALLQVARTPGVNPAAAQSIVTLSANMTGAFGGNIASNVKTVLDALSGGTDGVVKLGLALNAFNADEAANLKTMQEHGQGAEAVARGFNEITTALDGRALQSLSDFQKAVIGVTGAWDHFMTALATSPVVGAWLGDLKDTLDRITAALGGQSPYTGVAAPVYHGVTLNNPQTSPSVIANPTGEFGMPGAATFDSNGLPIDTASLQRLATVLTSAAASALPSGYSVVATSTERPGATVGGSGNPSLHASGQAIDVNIVDVNGNPIPNSGVDSTGLYTALAGAAAIANQQQFPGTSLAWGGRFGTVAGGTVPDLMHFDTGPDRGTLAPSPAAQVAATTPTGVTSPIIGAISQADLDALNTADTKFQNLNKAAAEFGQQGVFDRAYWGAFYSDGKTGLDQITDAWDRGKDALATLDTEVTKANTLDDVRTKGILDTAAAYLQGEVPGLQAAAKAQADLAIKQNQATDANVKQQQILSDAASAAIDAGAKALPGLALQADANQKLADAAAQGTDAEHEAALQNAITAATHNALATAIASGNPVLIAQAKAVTDGTAALMQRNDVALQTKAINDQINANSNQIALDQLELSLQGQSTEQINAQVLLLRTEQQLKSQNVPLDDARAQAELKSATALNSANIALAQSQQEWGRINNAVIGVGQTLETDIVNNMTAAFDNQKVTSWGTILHQVLAAAEAQILDIALLKPAIGSVLATLGLPSAGASFGSFGKVAA